jgi:hypothetical protein
MSTYCICGHVAEDHNADTGICLADDQCDCDGFIADIDIDEKV